MTKILVLYYSSYGHIEQMAQAVADGARESGADVVIKRVPEIVPPDVAGAYGFKLDQAAPIAVPDELADYDGIVFGVPTRFGGMAAQMRNFLDQTGGLWHSGALIGKVASMFTSSATQHGGQEATILTSIPTFLHHGMIIVGLPYSNTDLTLLDEVSGGTPYGASTISGSDNKRQPSERELGLARAQGRYVAQVASRQRQGDDAHAPQAE
ncbi:NAD(P)H:quinone oxidoreductase [Sphingomonas histidinilytica]|uniref:NAD(P)H:quinone oxidoreductase n=1 Tax=Rhizorhabdus histidinilytica TaxID=439228 RepID=UPI001ADC6721|nr:NAD(P)H:quinone oxidoreductase [Rhizorhabdus histidinilytica]MBO9379614.1 NAD(P)H:quinone oxidoreductase [Rhizorhabdus histidinilytica]